MRLIRGSDRILLISAFSPVDSIKGQLKSIRSSYFVEDPEQIVAHRVLTQMKLLGNVAIGHPFGHQLDNAFFPLCQQARTFLANRSRRQSRDQGIDHEVKFLAASPHLSLMNCMDAFAQELGGLIP